MGHPTVPVGYTLPQSEQHVAVIRDTKDNERKVLVAEMQEIIEKVMKKMEREADYRPLHADGVFNYDGDSQVVGGVGLKKEHSMTFSDLMKMDKKNTNRNLVKQKLFRKASQEIPKVSRVKFETEKKLTIDPVISDMMRNVDDYQKHSEGNNFNQ